MDLNTFTSLLQAGLPLWILTGGGLLCLVLDALLNDARGKGAVYLIGVLVCGAALVATFRQWIAGVNLASDLLLMDRLTQFFEVMVILAGLLTLLNSYAYLKATSILSAASVTLVLFAVVGMILFFGSDHLIVNFIGLETMSLAIYILVGSNRRDLRSNEAAMKYYVMGSVASAFLLYGIALIYGSFGTLDLSELAKQSLQPEQAVLPKIAVGMILAGMLFKLALVPFHFWAPDVYEGAPSPITGFMATGVKVAAFALFIRILAALNFFPFSTTIHVLSVCVILTLLVGNLGAVMQDNVKRMLAYSSIAHAGYLLLGLLAAFKEGKFDPAVSSAVLFYLIGYTFMTLGAFAVLSVMVREKKEVCQYADLKGLGSTHPVLAAAFSLFLISLMGIPPTVGFVAKYQIFSYAVKNGYIGYAILGAITVVISAYYYLRPLVMMYFREPAVTVEKETHDPVGGVPLPLMLALVLCAVAVIYLGVQPSQYFNLAQFATEVLK